MRHADMAIAPLPALAPATPARPTAALGGGGGFGGLFGEVQGEVADYIRNGDGAGFSQPSLTPAAQALRARVDAAPAATSGAQQAFLEQIAPWAREAGEMLGVAPELVSAHAALESGWGQRPLQAGGASSNNLFGVKAGAGWNGAVAQSATTEYVQGAAVRTSAAFRAYPDQASAFRDYAKVLLENPRFRGALGAGSDAHAFAEGLARGGYASDPAYAAKLQGVAARLQRISG